MAITILAPLIVALVITLIFTPIVIKLAKRTGLVDDPSKGKHPAKIHKKPIPRAGGLPIYIGIALATIALIPLTNTIITILLAGGLVVIVGLLDDKYDISPYARFASNIAAAAIVVLQGIQINFITNPLGGTVVFQELPLGPLAAWIPFVLAIIWIVWVMNMLNWSKGVDGQMPGIAAISAVIIGIASLRFDVITQENVIAAQLAFATAGAALGFLFFNMYPAKIFPGYSATILGFLLAILALSSSAKLATALLVMGIPTVDAIITVIRRLSAGKSPFWHDKGHLHHLLLDSGVPHQYIAPIYWVGSFVLGIIALTLSSRGKLFAIILVLVVTSGIIITLRHVLKQKNKE